jgi:pimeloyl-ACP methyl ester carboxylesterase
MPTVEIGGREYFYLESGSREAPSVLLCVHGSGGTGQHFAHQMALGGSCLRVCAPDLPGHGRSPGGPFNRVEAYREWIRQFAAALGATSFFLAGHSLGGAIALDYARCYPQDLAGLILIGTGARLRVAPVILDTFGSGRPYPELVDWAYGPQAAAALRQKAGQEVAAVDPGVYFADFSACNVFDMMNDLGAIDVRTLVLVGAADRLTPPKFSVYLAQHLPRAVLLTIPEAGHMCMLEKPDEVNEAVARFVAG